MKRLVFLIVGGLLLLPLMASAQVAGVGPRLGLSVDPDQFTFGGQLKIGPYSESFFIVPNLEIGVGDDLTIIQFNGDFDWMIPTNNSPVHPYIGGGLGIAYVDWDDRFQGNNSSSTEVGINFLGGLEFANKSGNSSFFTELRLGIGDLPDLKAMVGWNFGP